MTMTNNSSHVYTPEEIQDYLSQLQHQSTMAFIPALVYLCLLIVVGSVGNSLVLVVYYSKMTRTPLRIFIISMAAIDLLTNVFIIPGEIYDMLHIRNFDLRAPCRIRLYFIASFVGSSTFLLVAIAATRYKMVCRPFMKKVAVNQTKLICLTLILSAYIIALPYYAYVGSQSIKTPDAKIRTRSCHVDDRYVNTIWPTLHSTLLICIFLAASCLIIIFYACIGYKALKQTKHLNTRNPRCSGILAADVTDYDIFTLQQKSTALKMSQLSRDPTLESTSQIVDNKLESTSQIVDHKLESTSQIVNHKLESTSQIVDNKLESTSQIVDHKLESTSQIVDNKLESTSQIVDNKLESTSQIGDHKLKSTSQIVDNKLESTSQIFDNKLESTSQIGDNKLESTSQIDDNKLESTSQIVDNKLDSTSQIGDHKLKNTYQIVDHKLKSTSQIGDHKLKNTYQIVDHKLESTSQIVDHKLKNTSQIVDHKLESTSQIGDQKLECTSQNHDHKLESTSLNDNKNLSNANQNVDYHLDSASQHVDHRRQSTNQNGARNLESANQKFVHQHNRHLGRTNRMMLTITIVFFIGFLPFMALNVYFAVDPEKVVLLQGVSLAFYQLFFNSYLLNSAANPIVYSLLDRRFRMECLKLCKR